MSASMIGVLKERKNKINNGSILQKPNEKTTIRTTQKNNRNCNKREETVPNQVPLHQNSDMDMSEILNCRRRLEWTKEWLRKYKHEFLNKENIRKELLFRSNEKYYYNYFFKITDKQFRILVNLLEPVVTKLMPQRKRKTFSAEERIAITLKYLGTGEVNSCRNYCFLASKPVILRMIADICQNMYELLKDEFVSWPKELLQWIPIVKGMQSKHDLSNSLGYLLMQQVQFYKSQKQASRSSSIIQDADDKINVLNRPLILAAVVDDSHNFIYVDVEKTKADSSDDIFEKSNIRQLIEGKSLQIPTLIYKGSGTLVPCGFVGSSVFPEKRYLKSPKQPMSLLEFDAYHRKVNAALRMLCNLFPVLSQPLKLSETDAQKIIFGSVALYNFLRKTDDDFSKLTETIAMRPDEDEFIELVGDDDYCIEEERQQSYEFMPEIQNSMCFQMLRKQTKDISADLKSSNAQDVP